MAGASWTTCLWRSGRAEHTAILGPNGAGKSSFIRLITREDYPLASDNGTPPLLIFGQDLWNVFELRSRLGIISADLQAHFLNRTSPADPGPGRGIVGFFRQLWLFRHQKVTEAMREQARRALALMEAAHLAEAFIETMSTGETRRILIARALVTEPRALILDEPTTGWTCWPGAGSWEPCGISPGMARPSSWSPIGWRRSSRKLTGYPAEAWTDLCSMAGSRRC